MNEVPFWERSEVVEKFAGREPDLRLLDLIREFEEPASVRVLDLGCAGGRNTVLLAERGFDVVAVDASRAMVEETRRRLAEARGGAAASERVHLARMNELGFLLDGTVHLVLALGIYQNAGSRREWSAAIAETHRVLRPGGRLLVASHTDEFDPDGKGLTPAGVEEGVYLRRAGRSFLVSAAELDREMAAQGLLRIVETVSVRRPTEQGGMRVTANALYRKCEEET